MSFVQVDVFKHGTGIRQPRLILLLVTKPQLGHITNGNFRVPTQPPTVTFMWNMQMKDKQLNDSADGSPDRSSLSSRHMPYEVKQVMTSSCHELQKLESLRLMAHFPFYSFLSFGDLIKGVDRACCEE